MILFALSFLMAVVDVRIEILRGRSRGGGITNFEMWCGRTICVAIVGDKNTIYPL